MSIRRIMKYLLLILTIGCGKEAYIGTRDDGVSTVVSPQVCNPVTNYTHYGVLCVRRNGHEPIFNYHCHNGMWIKLNCQGEVVYGN
jgi:hypothetical protein